MSKCIPEQLSVRGAFTISAEPFLSASADALRPAGLGQPRSAVDCGTSLAAQSGLGCGVCVVVAVVRD